MKCPNCGLINPESALYCDCGYNFESSVGMAQLHTLPDKAITPWEAIVSGFSRWKDFKGRSSRAEFWLFLLFVWVALMLINFPLLTLPTFGLEFVLLIPIPSLTVRRLHDTNRSGWYYFIKLIPVLGVIILLIRLCEEGSEGANSYSPDSLVVEPESVSKAIAIARESDDFDKELVAQYQLAANQGDPDCQIALGMLYYRGEIVPQDNEEALKWWQLAANQGHVEAHQLIRMV